MAALKSYRKHLRLLRRRYDQVDTKRRRIVNAYANAIDEMQAELAKADRAVNIATLNDADDSADGPSWSIGGFGSATRKAHHERSSGIIGSFGGRDRVAGQARNDPHRDRAVYRCDEVVPEQGQGGFTQPDD